MYELFQKIEAVHGKTWNLWCTFDGKYVIQLTINKQRLSHNIDGLGDRECIGPSENLTDLLKQAAEFRFRVKIRRKPDPPPLRSRYSVQRSGSQWNLLLDNRVIADCKTKNLAEAMADMQIEHVIKRREAWDQDVLPMIEGKTEGVDYVFV